MYNINDRNKKKMILCENPKYIVHPHARKRMLEHGNYTLNGEPHFNDLSYIQAHPAAGMARFWKACAFLSEDFANNSYITDVRTGETYPIFMAVPCGHCILCREKKRKNLAFRCQAETNYWASQGAPTPLFVTLTYNNTYLPRTDSGHPTLRGDDVTRFLKRLRQNLIRRYDASVVSKLRYCLCGEYGSHTFRPHYHVLFWNFPNLGSSDSVRNLSSCINAIQDSWSTIVNYVKNPVTGVPEPVYAELGFISCYEATTGAAGYVAKYIGKNTPQSLHSDVEPPFLRRSCGRLKGLGYQWFLQWQHLNPGIDPLEKFSWTLVDPYTGGAVYAQVLPKYFVDKICPSTGLMLTTRIRFYLDRLESFYLQLSSLGRFNEFYHRVDGYKPGFVPLYGEVQRIFEKYDYYPDFLRFGCPRSVDFTVDFYVRTYGFQKVRDWTHRMIDFLISELDDFQYDKNVSYRNSLRRNRYYSSIIARSELSDEDLNYLIEVKNRAEYLQYLRESF